MTESTDKHDDLPAPQAPASDVKLSRRRLLRGSAAAAPAVLTLVSAPVMATGISCTTASNHTSASLVVSGNAQTTSCNGWKPVKYKNNCPSGSSANWPSGCSTKTTKFKTAFPGTTMWAENTFEEIIKMDDGSAEKQVAKHCLAAYLNSQSSSTSTSGSLPYTTVRNIWSSYCGSGRSYTPTAGVVWTASGSTPPGRGSILSYLQSTMPQG